MTTYQGKPLGRLFVDYTDWNGVRAWREIQPFGDKFDIGPGSYPLENDTFINTFIMHVKMVDRDFARRTLRVDHIHGFKIEG